MKGKSREQDLTGKEVARKIVKKKKKRKKAATLNSDVN